MEAITLSDISTALTFLLALGGSVLAIAKTVLRGIKKSLDPLYKLIEQNNLEAAKDFLVQILSAAERGELTEMEKIRLSERFEFYTKHGGNSYIKEWHTRLKDAGRI